MDYSFWHQITLFVSQNYYFWGDRVGSTWSMEEVGGNGVVGWRWYNNFPINSLAPGKFKWNFRHVIFKHILVIDGWGSSCEIALIWIWLNFTDDQSTLVQVMAWCHQATSHYLSQCWPRSLSSYCITKPQWYNVNSTTQKPYIIRFYMLWYCVLQLESFLYIYVNLQTKSPLPSSH